MPLNFILGTGQQALRQVPLLLIDLETEEGITGRAGDGIVPVVDNNWALSLDEATTRPRARCRKYLLARRHARP